MLKTSKEINPWKTWYWSGIPIIIYEIKNGTLDCGIISTPVSSKTKAFFPLFYEKFFAYISEQHDLFKKDKVEISDISEADIWYLDEGNCFQNQVNSICSINPQKKSKQNLQPRQSLRHPCRSYQTDEFGLTKKFYDNTKALQMR